MKSLYALSRQVMAQLELRRQLIERNFPLEQLQDAAKEVKILSGFLPICANCKFIRNDQNEWVQLESYINDPSQGTFTH
jgi:hypothetical protein